MHKEWPFFRTMLSNMDMVLAKTSLAIASRYADLVPDQALRNDIFGRICAEHARTLPRYWKSPKATACSPQTRYSPALSKTDVRISTP